MNTTLPFSMEEVAHRVAIDHLYAQYCHYGDASDIAGLDRVFLPDADLDYSADGAPPSTYAQARESDLFKGLLFHKVLHFYTNFLIEFEDGFERARVTMKVFCPVAVTGEPGSPVTEILGMYRDVLVYTETGWRIAERVWDPGWLAESRIQGTSLDMGAV